MLKRKDKVTEKQTIDVAEELRRMNAVADRNCQIKKELTEMEEVLQIPGENSDDQWFQLSEDVRSVTEKLKMVKGDVSMMELEVKGVQERLQDYQHKKTRSIWKVLATIELAVLITLVVVMMLPPQFRNSNQDPDDLQQTGGQVTVIPEPTQPVVETKFYISNLREKVDEMDGKRIEPFIASVESVDDLEALCFTYEDIRITYMNEFYPEKRDKSIRINSGKRQVIYEWDYNLARSLEDLAPKYGAYTGDEGCQLVFIQYNKMDSRIPTSFRMLDAERLWEYDTLDIGENLMGLFSMDYSERATSAGAVSSTYMEMQFSSVPYTYEIAQSTYVDAVYYGVNPLLFDRFFELKLSEEKMSFSAVVYTAADEYLGEISGEIATVDRTVVLKNVRFGAYVTPYQEDVTSDGIIVPRTARMTEYITISGKNRERYYIALSDEIARVDYDMNRLIQNENGYFEYFNEKGEKISFTGIDVSKYQAEINWTKVKAAGIDFAILRLGYRGMKEGTLELDPYYEHNIEAATKAGIPVGVYFFSQAITVQEAVEEAEMVIKNLEGREITYPVIFDTETVTTYAARANNLPRDLRTDIAIAFCETIAAAGYRPMIYANTQWYILGLDLERLVDYDKWYAYYGTRFTFPYHYDMLQYSDKGSVPGVTGNVDLNISFVDYSKYSR